MAPSKARPVDSHSTTASDTSMVDEEEYSTGRRAVEHVGDNSIVK